MQKFGRSSEVAAATSQIPAVLAHTPAPSGADPSRQGVQVVLGGQFP